MTFSRRLLGALVCATALLAPAVAAQAAAPGINVTGLSYEGEPQGGWQRLSDSGAKTLRSFVEWNSIRDAPGAELHRHTVFADGARARGMRVLLNVTGQPHSMATPGAFASVVGEFARGLRGKGVDYEIWNEEDDPAFWLNGPQPAAYAALLKAAYPAIKSADPDATVLVGGLVGNNYEFVEQLYDNGAKGSFDAVGVHTDTACLSTDPRVYYREPNGRIGRYSFTGYREVRATMLAHGDDKPIWMTELGWPTLTTTCARGGRAGTKVAGVSRAEQADFLTKAYGCLANDPYVEQAAWFNLDDIDTDSTNDAYNLGLLTDTLAPKPSWYAFQRASTVGPIACGGTLDQGKPEVRIMAPTDGAKYVDVLPIHIQASDNEGVRDIDLHVDGEKVFLKTVASGNGATMKYDWASAKNLSYGPHTLVATAVDEAKNVGRAEIKVTHVGGGAYPFKVPTKYALSAGKVRSGKVSVRGRITPQGGYSPRARGRAYVSFSRFDTKAKRWKRYSRYSRSASSAFKVRYTFRKRGVWRVTGLFKPQAGYKKATAKTTKFKVR